MPIPSSKSGIKGETDAAFQINFHYEDSHKWAVIHDLRLEFEGHAAQIDHLLINRFLEIYVCESKRFAEGIGFNEHGEFYRYSQGKPYAIESPIEQNNRHILLLKRLFDSGEIDLPTRLGFRMKPSLHSLILIANTSAIRRPKNSKKVDGMDRIIKVEQLVKRRDQDLKEENFLQTVSIVLINLFQRKRCKVSPKIWRICIRLKEKTEKPVSALKKGRLKKRLNPFLVQSLAHRKPSACSAPIAKKPSAKTLPISAGTIKAVSTAGYIASTASGNIRPVHSAE